MQFVNDMSPQFVNYRLSPFFLSFLDAIAHVLFVYKKFRELLSRHQFYSKKIHYTSQASFKTKLFSRFFLLKKKFEFQPINFIVYNNIIWNNQYLNFYPHECWIINHYKEKNIEILNTSYLL